MDYPNQGIPSLPFISIILPVYNGENYLRRCFDYIDAQDYESYEVIIIDDGSTDDTGRISREWASSNPKVRYFLQDNAGPGSARNAGLDNANGDYVLFLDPDDHYSSTLLSKLSAPAIASNADVVICSSDSIDNKTGLHREEPWHLKLEIAPSICFSGRSISDKLFQFAIGWPWDKLFKRSFIDEHQMRYPDLRNSEDGVFVFPLLCLASTICIVPEILISHEINRSDSVSYSRSSGSTCFANAIMLISEKLQQFDIMKLYSSSYLTWAIDFSLWNIDSAPEANKDEILSAIREKVLPVIDIHNNPADLFQNEWQYRKMQLLSQYDLKTANAILDLESQIRDLKQQIQIIEQSKSYKLAKQLSKIAHILKKPKH